MLAIRMQRTGRKGHAQFRVVVQDSRQSPSSGKFVALVGNYNPHTKSTNLVKDKIEYYLKNGAQPSDRAALLFKREGIKLPDWVNVDTKKQAKTRHPEKLRVNQPADAKAEKATNSESEATESKPEEAELDATSPAEAKADEVSEASSEETKPEPPIAEESALTESDDK